MELSTIKQYCRVDYYDDDDLIALMRDAVFEEMADVIPDFDAERLTSRQKILALVYIKDLYDNREKSENKKSDMRAAVRSMLLKEQLGA